MHPLIRRAPREPLCGRGAAIRLGLPRGVLHHALRVLQLPAIARAQGVQLAELLHVVPALLLDLLNVMPQPFDVVRILDARPQLPQQAALGLIDAIAARKAARCSRSLLPG